jgi:serine/threonine-protein kinase
VRHENVVTVFGAGMVGTEAYLAMEYVPGVDLHRLLRLAASENRALPASLAVYITWCMARALQAVHSAQDASGVALDITHGDVSPSNIYLSMSGEVKLGDFGVAHSTRAGVGDGEEGNKGKSGYRAPEQLSGEALDQRSDIFSLGVVLGEMLIGQKIFPGHGQLAIALSIREANIEPLRRAKDRLPRAVFEACTRALARKPSDRFPSAGDFAESLARSCRAGEDRSLLGEWVAWATDADVHGQKLEQRLRHSSGARPISSERAVRPSAPLSDASSVRRGGELVHSGVSFSGLLELAATGQLKLDDEVSVGGEPFHRVEAIDELSRYLMPSTASTTRQLFEPGVPDFTAMLSETPMLEVLARMRMRRESGALFVTRTRRGAPDRKDMYLSLGRLLSVGSSDREESLGQYVLHLKLITRAQLDLALGNLNEFGGKLGDTLVGLGLLDRSRVLRVIQNHARDRVAALCGARDGHVELYRGAEPAQQQQFPLELDLSVPMMAGAMLLLRQTEDVLAHVVRLHPGRRFAEAESQEERGDAPASLRELLALLRPALPLSEAVRQLMAWGKGLERALPEREARAAILVALALEWVRAE